MSKENLRKILLTGGTGMLGSAIAKIADTSNLHLLTPRRQELNLNSPEALENFIVQNEVDGIIHCAAKVGGIKANLDYPADFLIQNIQLDNVILSVSRKLQIRNLIYFGSSCMYPANNSQPMYEKDLLTGKLEPTNEGYALAKIAASKTVQAINLQDGLPWRVLIPSNLYGPNDNFDPESSHLIPAIIKKVASAIENNINVIEIWGDGKAKREFTYVYDLAEFVVSNFAQIENWDVIMNVGCGVDYSINEYYQIIARQLGYTGSFVNDLTKPSGMFRKLMDSSIAKTHGWESTTDIESGIERTIQWYKNQE